MTTRKIETSQIYLVRAYIIRFFTEAVDMDARYGIFTNVGDQINPYVSLVLEAKQILADLNPVDRGGYHIMPCIPGTQANRSVAQRYRGTKRSMAQQ